MISNLKKRAAIFTAAGMISAFCMSSVMYEQETAAQETVKGSEENEVQSELGGDAASFQNTEAEKVPEEMTTGAANSDEKPLPSSEDLPEPETEEASLISQENTEQGMTAEESTEFSNDNKKEDESSAESESLTETESEGVAQTESESALESETESEEETESAEPETEEAEWSEETIAEDAKGLSFSYDEESGGMIVTGFDGSSNVVEIPQTYGGVQVVSISNGAFRDQTMITGVVLQEGLTSIGTEAFSGCVNLADVSVPRSLSRIGARAFAGTVYEDSFVDEIIYINNILYRCKEDVSQVTVAEGTVSIADEAFADCKSLTSVELPVGLTYIGTGAFVGCNALIDISFPQSLEDIGYNALDDTAWYSQRQDYMIVINTLLYRVPQSMTEVTVPNGVTVICSGALSNSQAAAVTLPESLERIGYSAFSDCTALSRIDIPDGVEVIDGEAFRGCTALTAVRLPSKLVGIGAGAFADCIALQSIELPEELERISTQAFRGCTSLTAVSLPSRLASIGSMAFAGCISLAKIELPDSLTAINTDAFSGCVALKQVIIPANVTYLGAGAFADCSSLAEVKIAADIPAIRGRTFKNCTALTRVELPAGLKYIGEAAFQNDVFLNEIKLPDSVLTICAAAFEGSGLIDGFALPARLRTIGDRAFAGCAHLTSLTLPAAIQRMGSRVFSDSGSLGIICGFTSTDYMSKLESGWISDWSEGALSVVFTGGSLSGEALTEFLVKSCKELSDFSSLDEADSSFYINLIGAIYSEGQSGIVKASELEVRQAVNDRLGTDISGFYPTKEESPSLYYENGSYCIDTAAFAKVSNLEYALQESDESNSYRLVCYDSEAGRAMSYAVLNVRAADNSSGIAVTSKLSSEITDGYYYNVHESEETRQLSDKLNGSWSSEDGEEYSFDSYTRLLTVKAKEKVSEYSYVCLPDEACDYCLSVTDSSTGEVKCFEAAEQEDGSLMLTDAEDEDNIVRLSKAD